MIRDGELSSPCPESARLDAFLDHRLEAEQRLALKRHLEGCASCREERANLVALGRMSRALPRREIGAAAVQRAKSALLDRNRRRRGTPRRGLLDLLAEIFAERPLLLHGTAIACGLLISISSYVVGRWHEQRAEEGDRVGIVELAERDEGATAREDGARPAPLEPRLGAAIAPEFGRRRPGELVIESLNAGEIEPEDLTEEPEARAEAETVRAAAGSVGPEEERTPPKPLRPTAPPFASEGPVRLSAEAREVLEETGATSEVLREIGEALPNWAKILLASLPEAALDDDLEDTLRTDTRNMTVVMESGDARLRLHLTIVFGSSVEPRVKVNRAEARPLERIAAPEKRD